MKLRFRRQQLPAVRHNSSNGFTMIELIVACVIFPIIVVGIATAFEGIKNSYTVARQLNEIYTVLSACPEIDRALEFSSLTSSTNCTPNNSFAVEDTTASSQVTYTPTLTVTDTTSLSGSDPLSSVPDSKVVGISVKFLPPAATNITLQLRMLITRNGIGQL